MQGPIEVNFKNIRKTKSIERLVYDKVSKLEQICGHMVSCRVTVEKSNRHQKTGSPFRVLIDMMIPPGHELVVKHKSTDGDLHDTLSCVLRGVFSTATRQLKKLVQRQQGEVKHLSQQEVTAFISQIFPEQNYGFIKTINGREIYFHKNSVLHNKFECLKTGTSIRFSAELGEKGPQATTVEVV